MFSTVIVQCNVTTVIVLFCNNVTLLLCNMRTNPKSACLCIQMCLYSVTTQIKASVAVKVYLKPMLSLSSKIHKSQLCIQYKFCGIYCWHFVPLSH